VLVDLGPVLCCVVWIAGTSWIYAKRQQYVPQRVELRQYGIELALVVADIARRDNTLRYITIGHAIGHATSIRLSLTLIDGTLS
jgi:hypothetical protein